MYEFSGRIKVVHVYVRALLRIEDTILLALRHNVSFGNGLYSMVGGKVSGKQTARQVMRKEIREEVGIDIPEEYFTLVHTCHRKSNELEFVILCFTAHISTFPAPYNKEFDKHSDVRFFPLAQLPLNILPAHKQIIECVMQNIMYSEHDW